MHSSLCIAYTVRTAGDACRPHWVMMAPLWGSGSKWPLRWMCVHPGQDHTMFQGRLRLQCILGVRRGLRVPQRV